MLTIEQLLYGMLLPSGNDSAFLLASYFGNLIFQKYGYTEKDIETITSFQFNYHPYYVKYFLKEMNVTAEKLGMHATHYDSPHGLQNTANVSTAYDICKLAAAVMQEPFLRKIVCCSTWGCEPIHNAHPKPEVENDAKQDLVASTKSPKKKVGDLEKPTYFWENTNKLLGVPGFVGTKTGITPAAGPCLASCYERNGY